MGPQGKWVEVQIRTKRMNEIAEKGGDRAKDNAIKELEKSRKEREFLISDISRLEQKRDEVKKQISDMQRSGTKQNTGGLNLAPLPRIAQMAKPPTRYCRVWRKWRNPYPY